MPSIGTRRDGTAHSIRPNPSPSPASKSLFRKPLSPCTRGRGVGVRGHEAAEKCTPHPQPLSPEYRREGSFRNRLEAPLPLYSGGEGLG